MDISRSEIVTLTQCPERAYATYREDSHGYVPAGAEANITALQGSALHSGGECLFNDGPASPWREAVARTLLPLPEPHRSIRTSLIRRALLGWSIDRLPLIVSEWKPLGAEIPFAWELAPGIRQPLRLDDILEHRSTGSLAIFDFKTAGSPDLNWTTRKINSKQSHLYIKALKDVVEPLGRHVNGIMYECIEIGKWDNKRSVHKSPFVTAYKKYGKVSPKWSNGSSVVDLTEWSDTEWLDWAQETKALAGLYWSTGVISIGQDQLERTQAATSLQVQEYAAKLSIVQNAPNPRQEANRQFQRNDEACLQYGWDHACPFFNRCWKGAQLDTESFEPRKSHHEPIV